MILTFIIANIFNVIIQTIKSIVTVKSGKWAAAIINAIAYGYYTWIIILTAVEGIDVGLKALIVGGCNLVGVFIVKWFEEKGRKTKLWKIELAVLGTKSDTLHTELAERGISHNYIPNMGKYTIFNCFSTTEKESAFVRELCEKYKCKYFVSETKGL